MTMIIVVTSLYFTKLRHFKGEESSQPVQVQQEQKQGISTTLYRREFDLEKIVGSENSGLITEAKASSGTHSCELNPEFEYGVNLDFPIANIPGAQGLTEAKISSAIWTDDPGGAQWVLEIMDKENKSIFWNAVSIPSGSYRWDTLEFNFQLPPEFVKLENSLKFYPWNKNRKTIWIDNINVSLIGVTNLSMSDSFKQHNYFFGFEPNEDIDHEHGLTDKISRTGKWSTWMSGKDSYSMSIVKKVADVTNDTLRKISGSVWLYPEGSKPDVVLVITVKRMNGETIFWEGKATGELQFRSGSWQKFNMEINIPDDKRRSILLSDELIFYMWNRSNVKVYADDLELVFGEEGTRPGMLPYADMNLTSRQSYSFSRYHGPYRVNYIKAVDLQNSKLTYLASNGNENFGELFPGQEILALPSKQDSQDRFLTLTGSGLELFEWCNKAKQFRLSGVINDVSFESGKTILYSIDVDGIGSSEILAVKNAKAQLLKIEPDRSVECRNNSANIPFEILVEMPIDTQSVIQVADFNADGKEDLLFINRLTGAWTIQTFHQQSWKQLSKGSFPRECFESSTTQLIGRFIPSNSNLQFLVNSTKDNKNTSYFFEYISSLSAFRSIQFNKEDHLSDLFRPGAKMMRVNVDNDLEDEILLLEQDTGFDLKVIDCDKKGFQILSRIEFMNYPKNCNPKFYEWSKLICGNFIQSDKAQLLFVLRNCLDEKFAGYSCLTYGGPKDLPDQIQMYSLKLY